MKQDDFPRGWDEEKVGRVLAHYEGQTEEEAVAEDEDAMRPSETVMSVPHDLVPRVRELIAKRRG
jgi:type II secretory pathway component PulC